MTLNHNPRVTAERRLRINRGRLNEVCAKYRKWCIEYEKGVAARMYWTGITYAQLDKAARVRKALHSQINADEKFLKGFR